MNAHCRTALITMLGVSASFGAALGTATGAGLNNDVELIPREVFFGNPDRASVSVSPDGKHLAYLAPWEGVLNVWVQTIGEDDARAVTRSEERPIRSYFWAQNAEQIIYSQDRGGDEDFKLYAVDLDTLDEFTLTPFDGVQARVVATDRDHPDTILAAINERVPQLHDVWKINTRTGEKERIYENNEGWISFISDTELNLRIVTRMSQHAGTDAFFRNAPDEEWRQFASWDMEDAMTSSPIGFARDNETMYLIDSRGSNTAGLYRGTLNNDGELVKELIYRFRRADVNNAVINPKDGHVQAVASEYDRVQWEIIDDSIREDWERLKNVRDGDFSITSRSHDDSVWTVAYTIDDGPVHYYLYQRDQGEAEFLFTNRTKLEGKTLASMTPVIIESRDGLNLVSYLTTPPNQEARNLPLVLLVHGGPWARDRWGYNSLHQWLANRGYAVLSVNFRGSTGFGKNFLNAGNREWSGKMHDDLMDGMFWAVDRGIADIGRVAIMGGSYGGYATLVGMTFTPHTFAAGVSIVGPSHVRTLLESIPPYWAPMMALFETRVGSLDEPEYLDEISPLTRVDEIRRPLLIGQGANDPRVKEAESEQIVAAMQQRNIPVTYVLFPDEGHGFARPVNSMAFWAVTEAFLAEHLGGRYEPIGDAMKPSSAKVPAGADIVPGLKDAMEN